MSGAIAIAKEDLLHLIPSSNIFFRAFENTANLRLRNNGPEIWHALDSLATLVSWLYRWCTSVSRRAGWCVCSHKDQALRFRCGEILLVAVA